MISECWCGGAVHVEGWNLICAEDSTHDVGLPGAPPPDLTRLTALVLVAVLVLFALLMLAGCDDSVCPPTGSKACYR